MYSYARWTRFELATSSVTGKRSNQLSYHRKHGTTYHRNCRTNYSLFPTKREVLSRFWYTYAMKVRPSIVTFFSLVFSVSAAGVIVTLSTPDSASALVVSFLIVSCAIAVWSLMATTLLVLRQSISQAVWVSLIPALTTVLLILMRQSLLASPRLLGGVLLATLVGSLSAWWHLRRFTQHHD